MSSERPQQEQASRYAAFLQERFETQGMLAELQETLTLWYGDTA